ncbi:unnamed protein product [Arabidopsis arenosa]|uniref:Uncharacterized protein n=1 Tax=Arabidopsis arenosa TaxID=38785 RepID=A0A8S2AUM0_ARAAE|nr:unnamed protein product [Arabidopsis arenosa]
MSTIHQMLTNSSITLPVPLPPGFFFRNGPGSNPLGQRLEPGQSNSKSFACSVDEATITDVNPRLFICKRRKQKQEIELPTESVQFDLKTIEAATSNFSEHNKLGVGGFGEVYKGMLLNGTEIAVKRLSKTSGQGEEKLLVYEFVTNKSLDYFLFDPNKRNQLDWTVRRNIIDADMNPKIADFGMARIFGVDQTVANTARVVGTFGYMSPEYVTHGQFSMKSDVYSFGVLILEIISGKKNSSFYQMDGLVNNLVTYVWKLWENKSLHELIDPFIKEDCKSDEVIRYIHIGLLCVQENPADRPTMSTIYQVLTTSSITLPVPQPPGFFFRNGPGSNPSSQGLVPGFEGMEKWVNLRTTGPTSRELSDASTSNRSSQLVNNQPVGRSMTTYRTAPPDDGQGEEEFKNEVWRLWNNESILALVDPAMGENYDKDEVIRCIHIGLLCVQENPADRPTMSTVFQMLTNTSIILPVPQPPGFVFRVKSEPNPLAERLQPVKSVHTTDGGKISIINILGITVAFAFVITTLLALGYALSRRRKAYQEFATERRSMTTYGTAPPDDGQGEEEFKNEVWRLWNNGSSSELIDPSMGESYDKDEVIRCIHISLLCVQENPADRPTMSIVFEMLTNTFLTLPVPQSPGFVFRVRSEPNPLAERLEPGPSTTMSFACSIDDASITSVSYRFRASTQDPYFLNHNCPNTTTYSSNSTYFTNLKTLLSSLSSPNASYSTGFQNATAGQAPDRVTGLFLCRGDLSPEVCRNCVAFSVNETLTRCPNQREAVFYYEECMLRYSHKNILSTTITNEGEFILSNPNIISPIQNQINQFIVLVLSNMNQAAVEAANSSRKFSTVTTELTALQTLYGLVQCTPDITRQDCMRCLTSSINRMPLSRIGARQFWPSCNSRYELYAFYNETAIETPSPPPPPLRFPGQ